MFSLGILFSFLSAFLKSFQDIIIKSSLKDIDEYVIAFWTSFFSVFILLPFLILQGIPVLKENFYEAFLISGILNILTTLLLLKAYKTSEISLVSPISTLTPVFLMFISPFLIGEYLNIYGFIGVFFSLLGSYILNISSESLGIFNPIKSLFSNPGSRNMLLVAFFWSIASIYDKIGTQNSSPVFWVFALKLLSMIVFLLILIVKKKDFTFTKKSISLFGVSLLGTGASFFQMVALQTLAVIYVISIKRFSAVITVLFGYFFFHETNFRYRFIGTLFMIIGIIFLML